jgi:diguanylate cyclase (GGDEF)-like protein
LSTYLTGLGALPAARVVMVLTVVSLGAVPLALMHSPAGPQGVPERVTAVSIAVCCAALAALWVTRSWPSKRRSALFVVASVLCISAACLIVAPQPGLTSCTVFAAIGGYIAFFHTARFMMVNFLVAFATASVLAARVAVDDAVLAAAMLVLVIVANISVPFTCQALIQVLGIDALNSRTDPLTGLLNRRAFYRQAGDLMDHTSAGDDRFLVIVMLDLDKFKVLNDTSGHAVGDRALVAVGRALRDNTRRRAVVARAGGEEFLIADLLTGADATVLAERLRLAVVRTPWRLSASIGTVTVAVAALAAHTRPDALDNLIAVADDAMYEAKRAGGNQSRNRTLDDIAAA